MRSRHLHGFALTIALAFAQVATVVGTGVCVCSEDSNMPMQMAGAQMAQQMPTHHAPAPTDTQHHAPCQVPMSQGECAGMAACVLTAAPVALPCAAPARPSVTPAPAARALALQSLDRAPEPPPPRS
jgi:hypothetical protein